MSMHSFLSYTHKILNDVDIEIKKWNAACNKYTLYEMEFSGRPNIGVIIWYLCRLLLGTLIDL